MTQETKQQQNSKELDEAERLFAVLPEDWRIMGQPSYLASKTIYTREFHPKHVIYGHRRCVFCRNEFGGSAEEEHRGYYEPISHSWICETCYQDFCKYFQWPVKPWSFSVAAQKGKEYYETTDLRGYGHYIGCRNHQYPPARIRMIFPPKIEPEFQDVRYVYKANHAEDYAYEAYLEFTIPEKERFQRHIAQAIPAGAATPFRYHSAFKEFVAPCRKNYYQDRLVLVPSQEEQTPARHILMADISKILYSPEQQRIIYVSMAVNDGGATEAAFLSTYFARFHIDPAEYELTHPNRDCSGTP